MNPGEPLNRRRFLHLAAGAAALAGSTVAALSSCDDPTGPGTVQAPAHRSGGRAPCQPWGRLWSPPPAPR